MLRSLFLTSNYKLVYKSTNHKIQPLLYLISKTNIYTSLSLKNPCYKQTLPKLPVPKLEDTLKKYLETVKPLVTKDEFEFTKCLAKEFGQKNGIGEKLQSLLIERAKEKENWLLEWWTNYAYLDSRISVVMNVSPALVFPHQTFCTCQDRLEYVAKLIIYSLKFKQLIDECKVPLDKMGKDELDMSCYSKMYGTYRIPRQNRDEIQYNPGSRHIIIMSNNRFFKMCVVDKNKNVVSLLVMIQQLKKIMSQSSNQIPAIGLLSTNERNNWAIYYKALMKDPQNKECVKIIQSSAFVLCLDQPMTDTCGMNKMTQAGHQCLHGGGSKLNSGNRWFDKTLQIIVGSEGASGICFEHSPIDGLPITVLTDYILTNLKNNPDCGTEASVCDAEELEFNITNEIKDFIACSGDCIDKAITNFDLYCNAFTAYGKGFTKKMKLSPDSYLQMAMQFTYYKLHGKPAAQYEAAYTAKFRLGRTETIRSCSCEATKFSAAMLDCLPHKEKRKFLEAAVKEHKNYTVAALNGLGIDRHLLGLKLIAQQNGFKLPDLFKDPAFSKSSSFIVCTSQVATKHPGFMCYGPVVKDGYGLCYNPREEDLYYGISNFKDTGSTDSKKFGKMFESCLLQMQEVLKRSTTSESRKNKKTKSETAADKK